MFSTIDKAWLGGIASWLVNNAIGWLGLTTVPTEVTTAGAALITAVLVWLIPNKGTTYRGS
jgi:hypothetical protein